MFWKKAICPYKKENCSLKLTVHQLENKVEELEKEIISLQIPKPYMLFNEYWVYCLCKQLTTKEKKECMKGCRGSCWKSTSNNKRDKEYGLSITMNRPQR